MSLVSETATLAYGYTMADVEGMAWSATRLRPHRLIDSEEAYALAWHGVVEALYTADAEPKRYQLVGAGVDALTREVNLLRSYHGLGQRQHAGDIAPGFIKYWVRRDKDDDFTERIVERLALPAILGTLTPQQYQAISTLAAFDGDMHAAAAAIGVTYSAFESRVVHARRRLEAAWFDHETPRSKRITEGMCRNGHSRAEHSDRDSYGRWRCKTCQKSAARRGGRRYRERKKAEALAASGLFEAEADPPTD